MYRTMETIREKMLEVEQLNEQIARISVTYKSQSYDGAPKGGGGDGMDGRLIAKEFVEARRDKLVEEIRKMEEAARKAISKLPVHLYTFCTCYFLGACSVADTCKILDRDETTFYRYKREVKKMLGE